MLTAVFFVDAEYGWAVGHDETILNTADGGETWTRSHFAPEAQQPLLDLWFANRVSGIAVGAYGAYFTTNDGGRHWASAKFAPPPAAKKTAHPASAADDETCRLTTISIASWASATGCTSPPRAGSSIAPTTAARRWRALPSPYEGSFFGLVPIRGDGLLAFGLRGHLFRSADAGETWHAARVAHHRHADRRRRHQRPARRHRRAGRRAAGVGRRRRDFTLTQQDDRKGLSALLPGPAGAVIVAGEGGVRTIRLGGGS